MNSQPCATLKEMAAEKLLNRLYGQTVANTLDDIQIASRDNRRTANDRATLRGIRSQIDDLLAEASHYMV